MNPNFLILVVYFSHILSSIASPSVISSGEFSLFLKSDGTLWATGNNYYGQFGNGTAQNKFLTPIEIASDVAKVCAGEKHIVYLKNDGTLWGAGDNSKGQLGDGTTSSRSIFGKIESSNVSDISAGQEHTIWISSEKLWGVGSFKYGQLGNGKINGHESTPSILVNPKISKISAFGGFSSYIETDGSLWGMGKNSYNQIGTGYENYSNLSIETPVRIFSSDISDVSTGGQHLLILKSDGSLWGTGDYIRREIQSQKRRYPEEIESSDVLKISAGSGYSLYIKSDGSLWGIGENSRGELGREKTNDYFSSPIKIISENVISASAYSSHSLFIKSDGTFWSMGSNDFGQLGDGTNLDRTVPVQIMTDSSTTSVDPSSENNVTASADYSDKIDSSWAWFKYPWIYNASVESWCYLNATSNGHYLWCEKDKSWYSWDNTNEVWVKN